MRLDLFSKGDTILLLGEGNFSFSVGLLKHRLPIKIVASCFETECRYENQSENIKYLESNGVPVFLGVDATKLHENLSISGFKFSKIVFNFPHVGGKMKIHLNRKLLRETFESCREMLDLDGVVIVSLCRGQGGTPADEPQRKWQDSWQVTEMATHGDFLLVQTEPFLLENFPEYSCVGYRSQDVKFCSGGALVHVFVKKKFRLHENRMRVTSSDVCVPGMYGELYLNNPLARPNSPMSFLFKKLTDCFDSKWRVLNDDDVAIWVDSSSGGVSCEVRGQIHELRRRPEQIFPNVLKLVSKQSVIFPGMFFQPFGNDFLKCSPIEFHFVIAGDATTQIQTFLENLIKLFSTQDEIFSKTYEEKIEIGLKGLQTPAAILYNGQMATINAQMLCEHFFRLGWREIWAVNVSPDGRTIIPSCLYPSTYAFDITLRHVKPYTEEEFRRVLWLAAGQLIVGVDVVNEYSSGEGWSSICYRITYRSLDMPLHRERVVEVHTGVIGRALELELGVAIG